MKVYSLVIEGQVAAVGTFDELCRALDVSEGTVRWYASQEARERGHRYLVEIPDADRVRRATAERMNEACSAMVRASLGRCMESRAGCDGLGWCKAVYKAACLRKKVDDGKRS